MKISKKTILISAGLVILAAGLVFALGRNHTTTSGTSAGDAEGSAPATGQDKSAPASNNSNSSNNSTDNTNPSNSGSAPTQPSGQFVASHTAKLGDDEGSTCTTSVGATCQISFSMNGVTISLPAIAVDQNGNALWKSWTPNQYHLTVGTWIITATATNSAGSTSVQDQTSLKVVQQ